MECDASRRLLEAYVDGELDLVPHLEIEAHLRTCAACACAADNLRAGRELLRGALPRHVAPAHLVQRLRAGLPAGSAPAPRRGFGPRFNRLIVMTGSVAAALAFGIYVGSHQRIDRITDDAVGDHVRSLQVGHLTDVVSTDQHTVKPWFAGKIDFSPPVVDLASAGFPLVGGRLDLIDHRTAAAIVYRRRQHTVNLFVWPVDGLPVPPARRNQRNGYNLVRWSDADLNFIAVSEIPADELDQFVAAVRRPPR
jgi:anti-sigma factor RsiW